MPVLNSDDHIVMDASTFEALQQRSINSLLGLPPAKSDEFTSQRSYCIPVGRVPLMDEFPNSPEGGQIPHFGSQHSSPERKLLYFDKLSEYDNIIRHPDSPDSHGSLPSSCSHIDGSISEMMNGLNINMPQLPEYLQNQRNYGRFSPVERSHDSDDRSIVWEGTLLPFSTHSVITSFSTKIFLGGLPWDIEEKTLVQTFKRFGPIKVDWPGRENNTPQPKGYAYIIFPTEKHLRYLLQSSTYNNGNWYYTISTRKMRAKQVQIIPWDVSDATFVNNIKHVKLDPSRTVFVGALHGMLTAPNLAKIMNDLFGGVVFAGIDTDKNRYPIGSGRVTFDNFRSYSRAVSAAYITIKTEKFLKKIQVDPYLEDSICSICKIQQGPYFCKIPSCFNYFCRSCWKWQHSKSSHKPLTRSKLSTNVKYKHQNGFHIDLTESQQYDLLKNNNIMMSSYGDAIKYRFFNNGAINNAQDI